MKKALLLVAAVAAALVLVVAAVLLLPVPDRRAVPPPAPDPDATASAGELGRVVARIDGRLLHEREVGIDPAAPIPDPPLHVGPDNFDRLRREAAAPRVRAGIEEHLLLQEARRRGLDRDAEHVKRMEALRTASEHERRQEVARALEQQWRQQLTASVSLGSREVDDYLAAARANPDPFGMDRELTPQRAEEVLRSNKGDAACQRKILSLVLDTPLQLDGVPVDPARLEPALRRYFPGLLGATPPGSFDESSLYGLVVDAMARRTGEPPAALAGDVDRFARAFGETTLSLGGRELALGQTDCTSFFAPRPTAAGTSERRIDAHGLALCLQQAIVTELLVREAERAGLVDPGGARRAERLALLERLALVEDLLRREGVYDVPEQAAERRRRLVERLGAGVHVELLY